eukprot:9298347-Alexandrium_andersonii.AAC.1
MEKLPGPAPREAASQRPAEVRISGRSRGLVPGLPARGGGRGHRGASGPCCRPEFFGRWQRGRITSAVIALAW